MARGTEEPIEGTQAEGGARGAPEAESAPTEPAAAGADLAADLAAMRAECEDLRARLMRAQADYQNQRRRTLTDVDNAVQRSMQGIFGGLLLVLDHLELALRTPVASDDARTLAGGVRLTRDQVLQLLRQHEIEPMPPAERFDPTRHEAVATVESTGLEPGSIVDTVRQGYTWRGRVLRAAHVRVARAPAAPESQPKPSGPATAGEGGTPV
jgi:molecular chaperone GrpE